MNIYRDKNLFPYLEGGMIPPGRVWLMTISRYGQVPIERDGKQLLKPALYLAEADRPCLMNKTNVKRIAELYGPETDNWPGKQIAVYAEVINAFGRTAPAIRIGPPDMPGARPPKAAAEPAAPTAQADQPPAPTAQDDRPPATAQGNPPPGPNEDPFAAVNRDII